MVARKGGRAKGYNLNGDFFVQEQEAKKEKRGKGGKCNRGNQEIFYKTEKNSTILHLVQSGTHF